MTSKRLPQLAILVVLVLFLPAVGQTTTPRRPSVHRHGPKTYMGRPIADVMSFQGADWLFRPEREQEEQPEKMLDALGIQPGWTVADVGAGAGFTSLLLSQRVGPAGTVLANDVQPQMLQMLRENARTAGVRTSSRSSARPPTRSSLKASWTWL